MKYKKPEMSVWSLEDMDVITTSDPSIEWDEGSGDVTVEMPD